MTRREGYLDALVSARRAFVILGAGLLALITLLTWRLAGPGPGAVAGLFLATDPFLAAHGQVAHLDATLTGFMTVAVLTAMIFGLRGGGLGYLALSGAATGLALLTKAPSIILLPGSATARGSAATDGSACVLQASGAAHRARSTGLGSAGRGRGCPLWPAFRVDPVGTIQKLVQFTARVGGGEHDNFFMGQATDDPGVMYYPTMVVFRLGLGTLTGIGPAGRSCVDRKSGGALSSRPSCSFSDSSHDESWPEEVRSVHACRSFRCSGSGRRWDGGV